TRDSYPVVWGTGSNPTACHLDDVTLLGVTFLAIGD
ncbi:MAG: hypothetical protein J07HQW1_02182, partial [Haloquadratum walsbyi J07HQW1]